MSSCTHDSLSPNETERAAVTPESSDALARSACCRVLSLLFSPPRAGNLADLRALARSLPGGASTRLEELAAADPDALQAEYHRVLGSSGQVPVCESDHGGTDPGRKGALLADAAGYYDAFAFDPSSELAECPDHVSVQWGFLGYLALKEALALARGETDRAAVCREAATSFHANHVETWFRIFLERVEQVSPDGFLGGAAALASELWPALAFESVAPDPLRVLPPCTEGAGPPSACCCGEDEAET
jgi:nitrate reductase assembly molybdenum cofactor insertion protein NarJ